ncbi:MAG TPA: hypothetical protein VEK08_21645 [Planctomycetota bacterium]|nr:hypothetical protein [Planctomycetota bacterium]
MVESSSPPTPSRQSGRQLWFCKVCTQRINPPHDQTLIDAQGHHYCASCAPADLLKATNTSRVPLPPVERAPTKFLLAAGVAGVAALLITGMVFGRSRAAPVPAQSEVARKSPAK